MAQNIIDICHRPGVENPVADMLSRMWSEREREPNRGDWSVQPEWEGSKGLRNDVFTVEVDEELAALHEQFKDDPWFREIIDFICNVPFQLTSRTTSPASHFANTALASEPSSEPLPGFRFIPCSIVLLFSISYIFLPCSISRFHVAPL